MQAAPSGTKRLYLSAGALAPARGGRARHLAGLARVGGLRGAPVPGAADHLVEADSHPLAPDALGRHAAGEVADRLAHRGVEAGYGVQQVRRDREAEVAGGVSGDPGLDEPAPNRIVDRERAADLVRVETRRLRRVHVQADRHAVADVVEPQPLVARQAR